MCLTILKLTRACRERVFVLVMLPAFFFGTLPQTDCICADGHREASCPILAGQKASRAGANSGAASCCQRHEDKKQRCCRAKATEPANDDCGSHGGIAANTGSCCHPVVEQA